MILKFRAGSEIVVFNINREKKILLGSSSKTNYRMVKMPWYKLFDKGKERYQDLITKDKSDDVFKICIIKAMNSQGYKIVR